MKLLKGLLALVIPVSAWAGSPQFTNIDDSDMKEIAKGLGANFVHNSMMPASKMGTIFGFQVGLVGAQTSVPKINDIVKENSGAELKNAYNAGVMGAVGIPFGIALEAVIMPTLKSNSAKASANSFALKWNINDVIPVLPVNLALRGLISNADFSFNQTISGNNAKVANSTTVSGVQLLFSPQLPIVEPYVGFGLLNSKDTLKVTGTTGTVFDSAFSTSQSESKSVSGTQILAGVEVNLLLIKLGVEYSNAFNNTRYGLKLAVGF